MIRTVFFGDSICAGQLVAPHLCWVHRHSARWAEEMPGAGILVSNVSVSGNTTRMALDRMKMQVAHTGVDVFYTQFGLNDANHWHDEAGLPRTLPTTYKANLIEIMERARAWGAVELAIGTNHPVPAKDADRWPAGVAPFPQWVQDYNSIVREVASETGAMLIDHEQHWLASDDDNHPCLMKDGVHLNELGHERYFEFSAPLLDEAVSRFQGK